MEELIEFSKNGISIVLKKDKFESDTMFYDRGWYIINHGEELIKNREKIEKESKIYVNNKYFKCKYNKDIN